MRLVILFYAVALLVAVQPASAQPLSKPKSKPAAAPPPAPLLIGPELWHGAHIGMTQDQITALFPKATASKGEVLPGGAKSALTLPVTAGGGAANAQFYFGTGGLETIIIDRPDVTPGKTDDNLAKARQVISDVTAERGEPTDCAEQRRLAALTCTWKLGEAKAVVSYRDVAGASPSLSVSYRKANDLKAWEPGPVKHLKLR